MKSNAAGQLLGYTIQFPRALYHLLKSGPGDAVCIEVLGDVATKKNNNEVIAEEDKSSLSGKPITDKSTDLWKTFFNWIVAIKEGSLDVKKTRYVLYCNKSGRTSIVDQFSNANNMSEAKDALKSAKEKLCDVSSKHDIFDNYDFVVNQNKDVLLKVICQFEVQYGIDAGYDDVNYEIRKKNVPQSQIDFLRNNISGWLLKIIQEKIAKKEPACISWEDYDHEFSVLFERVRKRELVDFTLESPPDTQGHIRTRPRYLRQLDLIGCDDNEIQEAASDFLRANVNRHKWIENELIDEETATDFTNKLKEFWSNQKKRIKITEKQASAEEKGQLLLVECKSRQETIRDMSPPHPMVAGTYHALAEEPVLGWHPTWEKLLSDQEEG